MQAATSEDDTQARTPDQDTQAPTPDQDTRLLTGSIVVITGLSSKPELNGTSAKVKGYITASGRYSVVPVGLESAIGIKRANLKQDSAARLPSAEEVDDESEYPLADAMAVLDVLDSLDDYAPAVAVACLTRCVKALMDEEAADGEVAPERALRGACNALRANARANHQHRELYGVAALNLPFLLLGPESAPALAEVEAALHCSVLGLLTGGLAAYVDDAELLSSSMIAVRQLLGCWLEGDDTVDFVGLEPARWEAVRASGLLAAVATMVAAHAPSLEDEGSLELHEHAIACWSAACGLQPDGARAAALCEAGAVPPTLRAIEAVTPVLAMAAAKQTGGRHPAWQPPPCRHPAGQAAEEAEEEEVEAAAELVRAACALLQALARTAEGRAALRCAGGAATLDALLAATGGGGAPGDGGATGGGGAPGEGGATGGRGATGDHAPSGAAGMYEALVALRRRLAEGGDAEEPTPLSEAERRDGARPRGDEVPSYSARGRAGDHGPKQKQRAAARAASGAERILPETTWTATATGTPNKQPLAAAVAVGKPPKAKPRKEVLVATYSY